MEFALIGRKLGHSFSKEIHQHMGLDYELVELKDAEAVGEFCTHCTLKGFNVTIPYKETVMPYLDYIDEGALAIGAVNTVAIRGGKKYGYNTDIIGIDFAMRTAGIVLKDAVVMILGGSGGTALTAKYLAEQKGASKVIVVSRSGEVNYSNCYDIIDTNVIINCTPVGMYPNVDNSPIDLKKFSALQGVFDAVYNPLTTRLIAEAKAMGLSAANGLSMLVSQAKFARDHFCGDVIKDDIIAEIIAKLEKERDNIVLIGMPSCGKSSVGAELAEKLGKRFVDTDALIAERAGCTIPEIFSTHGEAYFRDIESTIIAEVSAEFNCIISTGGGAILREFNRKHLRQNGFVVHLTRGIEKLSTAGRPLSKNAEAIKKLWAQRKDIYRETCDCIVNNNGELNDTVWDVITAYGAHTRY